MVSLAKSIKANTIPCLFNKNRKAKDNLGKKCVQDILYPRQALVYKYCSYSACVARCWIYKEAKPRSSSSTV